MLRLVPLSVVLIWRAVEEDVVGALRSLIGGVRDEGGEVLIVTALGRDSIETASTAINDDAVRWIRVEPPLTEPNGWNAGLAASNGTTLGFGQAKGQYAAGWARSVMAARANGADVVAGPVRLSRAARLTSQAAHLCDYAAFDDPGDEGPGGAAACNLAFDRRILDDFPSENGLHKCALLATNKLRVVWRPEMSATLSPLGSFKAAGVARFHRGRHYASLRAATWPRSARIVAGLGCLALPFLLFVRLIALDHVRRRYRRTLFLGSPWIATSLGLWSLGEMAGYWSGTGNSARFL
ncbi:MAG: hypothetical protein ABI353_08655 [Isosphaeraceae bacterium]